MNDCMTTMHLGEPCGPDCIFHSTDTTAVPIKIPDWPGLVSERNRLLTELDAARARIAELEKVEKAAQDYVMSGLCGDIAGTQREKLEVLIDVARTDR